MAYSFQTYLGKRHSAAVPLRRFPMNVLLVYAHPEPRSLNGALKEFAIQRLQAAGHQVQVSDLYAMGWKAAIDAGDSLDRDPEARFDASEDSRRAFARGRQSRSEERRVGKECVRTCRYRG